MVQRLDLLVALIKLGLQGLLGGGSIARLAELPSRILQVLDQAGAVLLNGSKLLLKTLDLGLELLNFLRL